MKIKDSMSSKTVFLLLFTLLIPSLLFAEDFDKELCAIRIPTPPKIDGHLDEDVWVNTFCSATDFIQRSPKPGLPASKQTEVKILYDDASVYLGITLYDASRDSILQEFTLRDDLGNTDYFTVYLDTYNDDLNAFEFSVTAAGVQVDARRTPVGYDRNWNAAWYSEVQMDENNWYIEMEIPFSALRFPKSPIQFWGVNFRRTIRRNNEHAYWNEIVPEVSGFINQFGRLSGIKNIKSPIRLSVSPYVSSYLNHYSGNEESPESTSTSFKAGMDLRYGINDAFTLDMILIPDFGQVASDNKVLNLSPFEVQYAENRQFFKEGTELFDKGDFLYSRRIGGKPIYYKNADDHLADDEEIVNNPTESKLINATKISGRTRKGLGIGLLNAMTSATYATIRNGEGIERQVLTNPFANYNVVALDQNLKNNSYVSLINTNVLRKGEAYDANLTGGTFRFANRQNSFAVSGRGALSQKYGLKNGDEFGFMSYLSLAKIGGNFRSSVSYYVEDDRYDPNDLGYLGANNEMHTSAYLGYRIYEPFWHLLDFSTDFSVTYRTLYKPNVFTSLKVDASVEGTFRNFLSLEIRHENAPVERYDYFEPRVKGRYVIDPKYQEWRVSMNTDSRKQLAVWSYVGYTNYDFKEGENFRVGISPRFRINNKLSFSGSFNFSDRHDDFGHVDHHELITFGLRDIQTVNNIFSTKYTFNNKMGLAFRMRHYWSEAEYKDFYTLTEDGRFADSDYAENENRNYNAFNIDMVYSYTFAPASEISIVWKNSVTSDEDFMREGYTDNINQVLSSPQNNNISVRILYYLDYSMLKKSSGNNGFFSFM